MATCNSGLPLSFGGNPCAHFWNWVYFLYNNNCQHFIWHFLQGAALPIAHFLLMTLWSEAYYFKMRKWRQSEFAQGHTQGTGRGRMWTRAHRLGSLSLSLALFLFLSQNLAFFKGKIYILKNMVFKYYYYWFQRKGENHTSSASCTLRTGIEPWPSGS